MAIEGDEWKLYSLSYNTSSDNIGTATHYQNITKKSIKKQYSTQRGGMEPAIAARRRGGPAGASSYLMPPKRKTSTSTTTTTVEPAIAGRRRGGPAAARQQQEQAAEARTVHGQAGPKARIAEHDVQSVKKSSSKATQRAAAQLEHPTSLSK